MRQSSLRHRFRFASQRRRLTYANVMATIAVFIALGGSSYAALRLPGNSVGTAQLRAGAVNTPKLRNGAVTSIKLGDGAVTSAKLAAGAVTNGKIANGAITAAKVRLYSLKRNDFAPGELKTVIGPRGPQGPRGQTGPQGPAGASPRWALISSGGSVITQSDANISLVSASGGTYVIDFHSAVSGHGVIASATNDSSGAAVRVSPCGGGSDSGGACPAGSTASQVVVTTLNGAGSPAAHAFYVAVLQ